MKTTITTHIDNAVFGVWDAENDTMLTESGDIAEYLEGLSARKGVMALSDAMQIFTEDLKENLRKDLIELWTADD